MTDGSGAVIGVLALQGDFAAHQRALERQGLTTRRIRRPADLVGLDGVALPGGESTTMLRLLELQGLTAPLRDLIAGGLPTLATCAGLILLANRIDPDQPSLRLLDIDVERNGYGRQIRSASVTLTGACTSGVFIRAPRIIRVGLGVDVLARRDGDAVLVQQGSILAACFHPELELDHPVTRQFAERVAMTIAAVDSPFRG